MLKNLNNDKIQGLVFLLILNIIILISSIFVSSNLTYSQFTPDLQESGVKEVTNHLSLEQNPHITVGTGPTSIGVNSQSNKIYVVNSIDNTVSVIDATNHKKIGTDIKVGPVPTSIAIDSHLNKIYVASSKDNTLAVIYGLNDTKIKNIKVGATPEEIAIDSEINQLYVTNYDSNTVSVIDGINDTKIKNIKVGAGPSAIAVNEITNKVYVGSSDNNTVTIIDGIGLKKIGDVNVGESPLDIGVNEDTNKIYVANYDDNTVSVIDGENDTNIKNIKVGASPSNIGINEDTNKVYVGSSDNNTVSVIDGENDTNIKNIKVGASTWDIGINKDTNKIYVANYDDNTVSVVDGENDTKIGDDIKVGKSPFDIGVNEDTNKIYVTNLDDNTVSVIDGDINGVVAQVMFNTEPFNAGYIVCDGSKKITPIAQQIYMHFGVKCKAIPIQGFEFVSWQENLGGNSTQLIQFSFPSDFEDSILDFLHIKPDKPQATLNITKFGSFTANFKAIPPPIPPEYLLTLFGIMLGVIIPSILHWDKGRRQRRNLREYIKELPSKYDKLGRIKLDDQITDLYTNGKINESQHAMLKNKIREYYDQKGI